MFCRFISEWKSGQFWSKCNSYGGKLLYPHINIHTLLFYCYYYYFVREKWFIFRNNNLFFLSLFLFPKKYRKEEQNVFRFHDNLWFTNECFLLTVYHLLYHVYVLHIFVLYTYNIKIDMLYSLMVFFFFCAVFYIKKWKRIFLK